MRTQNWVLAIPPQFWTVATIAEVGQNSDPIAQPSSVPKKERVIHGGDFRVVNWLLSSTRLHVRRVPNRGGPPLESDASCICTHGLGIR